MENKIKFKGGSYIFKEGEPADYVFQVLSGEVSVFKRNEFIEKLKIKDYVGAEGIALNNGVYEYTVKADTDVELVAILNDDFEKQISTNEEIALYVAKKAMRTPSLVAENVKKSLLKEVKNFESSRVVVKVPEVKEEPRQIQAQPKNKTKISEIAKNIFKEETENKIMSSKERFLVAVATIENDEMGVLKEWVLSSIYNIPMINAGGIDNLFSLQNLNKEIVDVKDLISSFDANCIVWGGVDSSGRLLELHFSSSEDPYYDAGMGFSYLNAIFIPFSGGNDYYRLLRTCFLGSLACVSKIQEENLNLLLEDALIKAHVLIENPNINLSSKEHAYNLICYANCCFKKGVFEKKSYKYLNEAIKIYNLSISLLSENEDRQIALVNHQLGRIYDLLGKRSGKLEDFRKAVFHFEASLKTTPKEIAPLMWAIVNFKLGELFFKLATSQNKEDDFFKSVSCFDNAANVYTIDFDPLKWAEIMNSIARVLFVHGEEYRDYEEVGKGVSLLKSSLKIRSKDIYPLLWANTESNLGTGLFLLGRFKKDKTMIYEAKEAFSLARDVYIKTATHIQAKTSDKNINLIDNYLEELRKDKEFAEKSKVKTIFDAMEKVDISSQREEGYNDWDRRDIGEY